MTTRRRFLQLSGVALAMPAISRAAYAQSDWPTHNVRTVIPFSAGSSSDILGRIVMEQVSRQLGQNFVIENRGGAGGSVGAAQVARSDADGYTLLVTAAAHSAAPAAFPNITYDPSADFAGVALFGTVPNVLIVAPSFGVKTVQEFVAKAKTKDVTYSSAGVGSATHWAAERFRLSAGFKGTHVPFRGGPEATTEVMTGRVDFCCMGISSALPFIKDKKVIPLAVSTPKRSSILPDVPTTLEAGYKDSDYSFWNGALFPAKTPRAIVDKLAAEINKAVKDPNVVPKLQAQGMESTPMTPAEFDALIKREIAANKALVKAAGLKFG